MPSARLSASRPADSRTTNHPNVAPHTLAPCHGVWCARAPSASLMASLSCSLSLRLVHVTQTAQNDSAHVRISRGTKRTVNNHNNKWLHGLTDEELVCARAMQCPGTQLKGVGPNSDWPVHFRASPRGFCAAALTQQRMFAYGRASREALRDRRCSSISTTLGLANFVAADIGVHPALFA